MKFKGRTDETKAFKDVGLDETELDPGLAYTTGKWKFKPKMSIAVTSSKTTLKPQMRIVYKTDLGLTTALRYRYEIANFIDGEVAPIY
ncbi:hypothetical protein [Desulforhopalus sp. 52FAK]